MPPIPMAPVLSSPSLVAISPLLTVFGFLTSRAATMSTRDILFLLGLGLNFSFGRVVALATPAEGNAILEDMLKIVHT